MLGGVKGQIMAKIIHTNDKIKLSNIDMATLHAIAERDGLEEIPDYTIYAINPQLYDEAVKKADTEFLKEIAQLVKKRVS
jgi:hypothetical protein